ncbi:hypothetical protein BS78_08G141400 [Paspalum vaginatum]|nr:hypothetical protein BS78_08G141400 [Paspalum vaginatum]
MAKPKAKRANAAAFLRDAPLEVRVAILLRLSPKWIIRMRAVCRLWRDVLSHPAVLSHLHNDMPPRPLLCFDRAACCPDDRYIELRDYCVESLVLQSGELRPVLRFADNDYLDNSIENIHGRYARAIHVEDRAEFYERIEKEEEKERARSLSAPHLVVHASLDGHLLIRFIYDWFVVNPATRDWAAIPPLVSYYDVVGFYEHVPSSEYRLLCVSSKGADGLPCPAWFHVTRVGSSVMRSIGRPISLATPEDDERLGLGLDSACICPPIQLGRNLHWPPQELQGYHILVFDTTAEVFRWMSPPVRDHDMLLLELPPAPGKELLPGKLGLSVSMTNKATLEVWSLEDYENEIWALLYRIQLDVDQVAPFLNDEEDYWTPAVVSPQGDVLIECANWVLHCDRNGVLLHKFWFPEAQGLLPIRHALKESLLWHSMYSKYEVEFDADPPSFFNWL